MREWLLYLFDLLLPPRRTERVVRSLTLEQLQSLGTASADTEALPYHDPRITALVWELKYYGTAHACTIAGAYISEQVLAAAAEELGVPLLVPVPMHRSRRRERGHNQTELLCRAALRHLDGAVQYAPAALIRTTHTKQQQGLPKQERLKNVRSSMWADETVVAGRACIVLDDVTTTGATLEEAKRALRNAGARAVHCISLARS